jgi:hypothetical protein
MLLLGIRERINAGLVRAKANGIKLGRRRAEPAVEARILEIDGQRRRDAQDWPEARHRHKRGAAGL